MTTELPRPYAARPAVTYVRAIRPLRFPDGYPEWEWAQDHRHMRLRALLYEVLTELLGERAAVGMAQIVYFDPRDPSRSCNPDGFVKLGVPAEAITSWKTWRRGAPDLCVEILTRDTEERLTLPELLEHFAAMGALEVVTFEADAPVGSRIRAWESVEGDFVERVVEREATFSVVLGKWFVVAPYLAEGRPPLQRLDAALRLADDPEGATLVPTPNERLLAAERARADGEAARADAAEAELARLRAKRG